MAYHLAEAGHHVTAVGRAPYVRAVNQRGLLVEKEGRAIRVANLTAVEHVRDLDTRFDLAMITTKAFDTAVAAVQLQPLVRHGTPVLIVQNGVGGVETAGGILGEERVYATVLTIPVESLAPAVIRPHEEHGGIGIAPMTLEADVMSLVDLLVGAGFATRAYDDWRSLKWSKLMLNMLANAIPAILDMPLERLYADRRIFALERAALREARAVMKKMGVKPVSLPGYRVPLLVWALCNLPTAITHPFFRRQVLSGRGGKKPSLHIDLERGRTRSEVEFLNGAVVRAGERLSVPTPVNRLLWQTLSDIAAGRVEWSEYRGQVERLLRRAH